MQSVLDGLDWPLDGEPRSVLFAEIGDSAMLYDCQVWVDSRLDEPRRSSELRTALVDALETAGVSVGMTSNLSSDGLTLRGLPAVDLTTQERLGSVAS